MIALHLAIIGNVKLKKVYVHLMANMGLLIVNFQIPEMNNVA